MFTAEDIKKDIKKIILWQNVPDKVCPNLQPCISPFLGKSQFGFRRCLSSTATPRGNNNKKKNHEVNVFSCCQVGLPVVRITTTDTTNKIQGRSSNSSSSIDKSSEKSVQKCRARSTTVAADSLKNNFGKKKKKKREKSAVFVWTSLSHTVTDLRRWGFCSAVSDLPQLHESGTCVKI